MALREKAIAEAWMTSNRDVALRGADTRWKRLLGGLPTQEVHLKGDLK